MSEGWIGVDFDGTLAMHIENKPYDPRKLGEPVPAMLARVKAWLDEGKDVRILTARVAPSFQGRPRDEQALQAWFAIRAWCAKHIGHALEVTCEKGPEMLELWDDRAVQIVRNTGQTIQEKLEEAQRTIAHLEQTIDDYQDMVVEEGLHEVRGLDIAGLI
jgi:hypothetical protein